MFIRKFFFGSLIIISFFNTVYGQDSNTVHYSLFLEKAVTFGTINTKLDDGTFKEGQSFTVPEAELSGAFSIYQDLFNALVGAQFGLDYGAIDNDLIMKIYIRNLDPQAGAYKNLGQANDTLFSYFEIRIWELPDSTFYHETSSYYLNEGHFATFSLPKSPALLNLLGNIGIGSQDSLAFAFMEPKIEVGDSWNGLGIETIDSPEMVKFKSVHLSRIGGGRKRISQDNFVPNIVNSVKINKLEGIPNKIELEQNYPNPFNPSTKIKYSVNQNGNIKLDVFNIIGQRISNIVNKYQSSGNYEVEFSTNDLIEKLNSGIYIYTLKTGNQTISNKMILMK